MIISSRLNPKESFFNPGTENIEFYNLLKNKSIKYLEACTLVFTFYESILGQ